MRPTSAIILVGGATPSRIRSQFGLPVCLLPLPSNVCILESWFELLGRIESVEDVYVVTGRPDDVGEIRSVADRFHRPSDFRIQVTRDLREHRGTAGTVRDTIDHYGIKEDILVVEGTTIPPKARIDLETGADHGDAVAGVLAMDRKSEPAGVICLRNDVFELVPEVGFFDLKEQLVPRILSGGRTIRISEVDDVVRRITSTEEYNHHIKSMTGGEDGAGMKGPWIHETARVDPSAIIDSSVVVGRNVSIGPGAVIIDSVILEGAEIRKESVVARSTIKANSEVGPGSRIVGSVSVADDVRRSTFHQRRTGSSGSEPPRYVGVRR